MTDCLGVAPGRVEPLMALLGRASPIRCEFNAYMYAPRSHMGLRGATGLYAEAGYAKDVSVITPCGEMRALRPF